MIPTDVMEWIKQVTYELNAIRARDGAPQHIDWYQGRPMQTSSVSEDYWNDLVEKGFAIIEFNAEKQGKGV